MITPTQEAFSEVEEQIAALDGTAARLTEEMEHIRKERHELEISRRSLVEQMLNEEGLSTITHPSVAAEVTKSCGLRRRSWVTGKVPDTESLRAAAQRALDVSYVAGGAKLHFARDLLAHPSIHINLRGNGETIHLPQELPVIFEALTEAEPLFHLAVRVFNAPGKPDEGTHEKARISKTDRGDYAVALDYYRGDPTYVTFANFKEALKFALE